MKLSGQTTIWADRETVWAALHDVESLAPCIPGCLALERTSADRFDLSVLASAGPVSTVLDGYVEIEESRPPRLLRLQAWGGGARILDVAGSVTIVLSCCAVGSRADWQVEMEPSGLLLRLSAPFLSGLAQRQIDHFARTFAAVVGAPPSRRSQEAVGIIRSRPPA